MPTYNMYFITFSKVISDKPRELVQKNFWKIETADAWTLKAVVFVREE